MNKDQVYGVLILAASLLALVVYTLLLHSYPVVMLQITAFEYLVLAISAWIGFTMATTPPPTPLERA